MDHSQHHAIAEFSYVLAFMTGLLGSGHCLGMCGGLVSSFFMKLGAKGVWPYLAYHGARVGVYGLVGLIAAAVGAVLISTGQFGKWQGVLQIIAGLVVILLGLDLLGVSPLRNRIGFAPLTWLRKQFGLTMQKGPVLGALIGGALVGTFLGVFLAYGIFEPFGKRLVQIIDEDSESLKVAQQVIIGNMHGYPVPLIIEAARVCINHHAQPTFGELFDALRK